MTSTWANVTSTRDYLSVASTATLTTQLMKRGFRSRFIEGAKPLQTGARMLGSARTLRYVPNREDVDTLDFLGAPDNLQRVLIEDMSPGDVLVVDGMRNTSAGSLGSILALRLQAKGVAGIVTDGSFRDTPGIANLDIPAYAVSQNANTNLTAYHPAGIDEMIGCGGVMVRPGDAVVGDAEGVVVIPQNIVEEVAHSSYLQELREYYISDLVRSGASVLEVYPLRGEHLSRYESWQKDQSVERGLALLAAAKFRRT